MDNIYFAQIREDSLVERFISSRYKPKSIVVIGSGGCTAFSVLADEVDKVIVVEQNPAQCALIELKKIAIINLKREDYLAFIGEKECCNRLRIFDQLVDDLPLSVQAFWLKRKAVIELGINQCGATEHFYRFIGGNLRLNVYNDTTWKKLFSFSTIEEQIAYYNQVIRSEKWFTAVKVLLSKTSHLAFFPSFMFVNANENDFGLFFLHQFEQELSTKLLRNNYFLSQLLFQSYLFDEEQGTPYYLSDEGYSLAQRHMDKLVIRQGSLEQILPTLSKIDAYYLSNVFDWATEAGKAHICEGLKKSANEKAVLLYRNMLAPSKLPSTFIKQFQVNRALSEECKKLERSMMYQNITVGAIV